MWWNTLGLRGAVTTPTKLDRLDSSCAALVMTRCGWSGSAAVDARQVLALHGEHGVDEQPVATRRGMRPALVCGLAIRPSSSRSAITLRMVAG